jgi:hypothetical protein
MKNISYSYFVPDLLADGRASPFPGLPGSEVSIAKGQPAGWHCTGNTGGAHAQPRN